MPIYVQPDVVEHTIDISKLFSLCSKYQNFTPKDKGGGENLNLWQRLNSIL